jgi:hypothetical protein
MTNNIRNIFISHIHEDDSGLGAMKELLRKNNFQIRDASINSSRPNNANDPNYIKYQILAPRIRWAGAMVVLISPGTHKSDWVNWEIDYAQKCGKPIIGVWANGAKDCDIPEKLDLYADAVVAWRSEDIRDAICGKINNWATSSGELRSPRLIVRFNC